MTICLVIIGINSQRKGLTIPTTRGTSRTSLGLAEPLKLSKALLIVRNNLNFKLQSIKQENRSKRYKFFA